MSTQALVEPVRRSRLSHQIVLQLTELIRDGRLRPGDRLPGERELAEQLKVSRSSLREALRTMESAGLVVSHHGSGVYVRDAVAWDAVSPLALVLQASGDTVGDLWEIRLIVEPEIAARAALRATADDLGKLDALVDHHEQAIDREDLFLSIDRELHAALALASRNSVAVRVVELMTSLVMTGRTHFVTSMERRRVALKRHREIVAAVRARDPEAARAAMVHHLQDIEAYIVGSLPGDQGVYR
jgi:GntR family transcriptional repressor for pyruvate dehydrogenase complex